MKRVSRSIIGTTRVAFTKMDARRPFLQAREKRSCSVPAQAMLFSSGDDSLTRRDRSELIALFSATKAQLAPLTLSDRLTLSLMQSGLVRGITPTSTRVKFGAPIPDFVLRLPDGSSVAQRSQD